MLEVDSTICRSDWSNLPYDLLSRIANSMGPFGYLSFCLVCKDWRNATLKASRKYKFSRCHPCFLLYGGESSLCSLLSNDGKIYAIDIPELNGATCLASYGGWLLVFRGGSLFFFCPFSRSQIELPNCPFTKLTDHHIAAFSSAPTSQDCIVVVIKRLSDYELQLHMLCRGDNIWAKHSVSFYRHFYFSATRVAFFFEGEFIFMDENGSVTFCAANTKQWNKFYYLRGPVSITRSKEVKIKLGIDANVSISTCGTLYPDPSDKFHSLVLQSEYIESFTAFESGHLEGVWLLPRCHHIPPDQSW